MASGAVKKIVIALAALVVAFMALVLALPFIASTQLLRDRVALELSMWSGYRVEMAAAPSLQLWPTFKARMPRVSFHRWDEDGSVPVMEADVIEAEMSALAALGGDVVFNQISLTRPILHLRAPSAADAGRANPPGRLRQSIAMAEALIGEEPADPDLARLPDERVGIVEFTEGRVTVHDDIGSYEMLTSLGGRLSWPSLRRPVAVSASGIWRGELVRIDAEAGNPLVLAAGGTAPLRLSVTSPLLNASFDGKADIDEGGHVDGKLQMSSPSLRRLLEWSHRENVPGAALGSIALDGSIAGTLDRLRLSNAAIALEGSRATGTLEIEPRQDIPMIAGTLAFESFDIQSFLSAFSALTPDPWGRWRALDDSVSERIGIDIRLSAQRASAGSLSFTDLAATAQIRRGIATFDISDASAFGGSVQAGMRVDRGEGGTEVEVRLRGEDIDTAELADTMQVRSLLPFARGTFSVSLKGRGSELYNILSTASGTFTASFGQGSLPGIDLAEFQRLAASGQFFPLSDVSQGTLAFTRLNLKAVVEDGLARLQKAAIETGEGLIELQGVVPLPGAGLTLAGNIARTSGESVPFFVGGSWSRPYISPIGLPIQ